MEFTTTQEANTMMLGTGNWIIKWHNPRSNMDGAMRAEDEAKVARLVSQLESLGNRVTSVEEIDAENQ